ncbi:MAG: SIMPL domain-containing protein [Verrucomicrobia bacterium]|nr:SIMPL domain-containing protein [Verrucomicrobiota bacterium]
MFLGGDWFSWFCANMKSILRSPLFGVCAGLALATALVASTYLVSRTWLSISSANVISVTGSARRGVKSDLVIWRGSFSVENHQLLEAQRRLKEDRLKVEAFLAARQITPFVIQPIQIEEIRSRGNEQENKVVAYRLSQTVEIQSHDVGKLSSLGTEAGELVENGVAFVPLAPEFIFTRIAEAKLELLAEATADAKSRAEQMARQGGRSIKQLRSAKMGVFQITPPHSTETSWEGINDKTTIEKSITATVSASFLLE